MNEMSRIDYEYMVFSKPNFIEDICSHVSNGGSVIDLAKTINIPFHGIMKWIRSDQKLSDRYNQAIEDRKEWAKETILKEIRSIATFDIRLILSPDGNVLPVNEWPDSVAKAISGIDISEEITGSGKIKKIKTVDKLKAIELMAKNLNLLIEKHEHSGQITLDQLIMATQSQKIDDSTIDNK